MYTLVFAYWQEVNSLLLEGGIEGVCCYIPRNGLYAFSYFGKSKQPFWALREKEKKQVKRKGNKEVFTFALCVNYLRKLYVTKFSQRDKFL